MAEITNSEITYKNLNIIRTIFSSQFTLNKVEDFSFPSFANANGKHIRNGRYLIRYDILTDSDLFNLRAFKTEMTLRYENSLNHNLLLSELKEVRTRASELLAFYNKELTRSNTMVNELLNRERELGDEENVATIEIINYSVWTIHFGTDMHSVNREYLHNKDYKQYMCDNQTLARYCFKLEKFINDIGLSPDGNFIIS
jgi:hypothetical protein